MICIHIYYRLLYAHCVIVLVYITLDVHLYDYCIVMDVSMSLSVSFKYHYIHGIDKGVNPNLRPENM